MPIVYITNRGPHDYSGAEHFGELVFCTDGPVDKFDTSQMYRELDAELSDSESNDYILLTSLTSLCSIACAIFASKHQRLNLLIHKGDGYLARSLVFDNSTKDLNGNQT